MAVSPDPHLAPLPALRIRRHRLPLISVLLACVAPRCLIVPLPSRVVKLGLPLFLWVPGAGVWLPWVLPALSVAALLGALVTGHLALLHARRYPPAQAGRGLAITALVLGYLSLAYVVWFFGSFLSGGLGD